MTSRGLRPGAALPARVLPTQLRRRRMRPGRAPRRSRRPRDRHRQPRLDNAAEFRLPVGRVQRGEAMDANGQWYDDVKDSDDLQVEEYDITVSPNDFNVMTLCSFVESGAVRIPGFQRNFVWDIWRASRLIESLILGLPVPQLFLCEQERNRFLVIDGLNWTCGRSEISWSSRVLPRETTRRCSRCSSVSTPAVSLCGRRKFARACTIRTSMTCCRDRGRPVTRRRPQCRPNTRLGPGHAVLAGRVSGAHQQGQRSRAPAPRDSRHRFSVSSLAGIRSFAHTVTG